MTSRERALSRIRKERAKLGVDTSGLAFPKPTKADRRAKGREERIARALATAEIRAACYLRAIEKPHPLAPKKHEGRFPRCEWCGLGRAEELHHMKGGRGRRLEEQSVENCALICSGCHTTWNLNPRKKEADVCAFCERVGIPLPPWFTKPSRVFAEKGYAP